MNKPGQEAPMDYPLTPGYGSLPPGAVRLIQELDKQQAEIQKREIDFWMSIKPRDLTENNDV